MTGPELLASHELASTGSLGPDPAGLVFRLARLLPDGGPAARIERHWIPGRAGRGGWFSPADTMRLLYGLRDPFGRPTDYHLVSLPGTGNPDWDVPVMLHELGHYAMSGRDPATLRRWELAEQLRDARDGLRGSGVFGAAWAERIRASYLWAQLQDELGAWAWAGRLWPAAAGSGASLAGFCAVRDYSVGSYRQLAEGK